MGQSGRLGDGGRRTSWCAGGLRREPMRQWLRGELGRYSFGRFHRTLQPDQTCARNQHEQGKGIVNEGDRYRRKYWLHTMLLEVRKEVSKEVVRTRCLRLLSRGRPGRVAQRWEAYPVSVSVSWSRHAFDGDLERGPKLDSKLGSKRSSLSRGLRLPADSSDCRAQEAMRRGGFIRIGDYGPATCEVLLFVTHWATSLKASNERANHLLVSGGDGVDGSCCK